MKVMMLKTSNGSDRNSEGVALPVVSYAKGELVELGESLAKSFIKQGVAQAIAGAGHVEASGKDERATEHLAAEANAPAEQVAPKEGPKKGGAPKRKNQGAAPENKAR